MRMRSILHAPKRSCLPHFFGCLIAYAHVVRDKHQSAVRAPNYLGCTNNQTRSLACTKSQQACMRSILHAPKRSCLPQFLGCFITYAHVVREHLINAF